MDRRITNRPVSSRRQAKSSPARHAPALGLRAGMLAPSFYRRPDRKGGSYVVHIGIPLLEIAVPAYGLFKAGIAARAQLPALPGRAGGSLRPIDAVRNQQRRQRRRRHAALGGATSQEERHHRN